LATPRQILVAPGAGVYEVTMNNSTDAVLPGEVVTTTGETADTNNAAWPDAASDNALGIVGCPPGHDMATAFATGEMMPVYLTRSGATVWARIKTSAGAIKRMTALMHDGGTAANGLVILAADSATLFNDYVGVSAMDSPDEANERWCMVRLV